MTSEREPRYLGCYSADAREFACGGGPTWRTTNNPPTKNATMRALFLTKTPAQRPQTVPNVSSYTFTDDLGGGGRAGLGWEGGTPCNRHLSGFRGGSSFIHYTCHHSGAWTGMSGTRFQDQRLRYQSRPRAKADYAACVAKRVTGHRNAVCSTDGQDAAWTRQAMTGGTWLAGKSMAGDRHGKQARTPWTRCGDVLLEPNILAST